ncbi:hypothetical protein [Ruminiclostridium josui]|nr:hypothetical protein [Ruminiclostridium josui]
MFLWKEYKKEHPEGIMYTKQQNLHAQKYKVGEEVEVDWAVDTMSL